MHVEKTGIMSDTFEAWEYGLRWIHMDGWVQVTAMLTH